MPGPASGEVSFESLESGSVTAAALVTFLSLRFLECVAGGAGNTDFLIRRMSMISGLKVSFLGQLCAVYLTLMGHVFVTFYTIFESQPTPLKRMSAPKVPVRVRNQFPVDFRIITNTHRVDSKKSDY